MEYLNDYYDDAYLAGKIHAGEHRHSIGGMWDEIGKLQFDFVRDRGLSRDMAFLDVGCGCLRGGIHIAAYLDPGRYFGIDLSERLLNVGYTVELREHNLQHKVPRGNLRATDTFDVTPFGQAFDMALAVSVFSHLPLEHLTLCLTRLASSMTPGGRFFITYFDCPPDHDWNTPLRHTPGRKISLPDRDPFHYRGADLEHATLGLPWRLATHGPWNHPRDQWMAEFVFTPDVG